MDDTQNQKGWNYFIRFWKYFFALVIVGIILLAFITL